MVNERLHNQCVFFDELERMHQEDLYLKPGFVQHCRENGYRGWPFVEDGMRFESRPGVWVEDGTA